MESGDLVRINDNGEFHGEMATLRTYQQMDIWVVELASGPLYLIEEADMQHIPEPTATDEMRDAAAQGLTDRLIP